MGKPGFWQSRERYKTQNEILSTVDEFRKRKIPLDNIVLDWSYWKEAEWGSQDFGKAGKGIKHKMKFFLLLMNFGKEKFLLTISFWTGAIGKKLNGEARILAKQGKV